MTEVIVKSVTILDYPTQTLFFQPVKAAVKRKRTVHFVVIPGNPSCCVFYIPFLKVLAPFLHSSRPDINWVFHVCSYAGQGVTSRLNTSEGNEDVSQTLHGQVLHKIAFVDYVLQKEGGEGDGLVFAGHSIGCHMINKLLLMRSDFLSRTEHVFHMLPFIRIKKILLHRLVANFPSLAQQILGAGARLISTTGFIGRFVANVVMEHALSIKDPVGRKVAYDSFTNVPFTQNFIRLGSDEMNLVPEKFNLDDLKQVLTKCGITFVYGGGDQWAPKCHFDELVERKKRGEFLCGRSNDLNLIYNERVKHDFCVRERFQNDFVAGLIGGVIGGLKHVKNGEWGRMSKL